MVAKTACLQGRARAQPIISQGIAVPVTDLRHAEVAIHDSHSPENESKDGFKSKKEKADLGLCCRRRGSCPPEESFVQDRKAIVQSLLDIPRDEFTAAILS